MRRGNRTIRFAARALGLALPVALLFLLFTPALLLARAGGGEGYSGGRSSGGGGGSGGGGDGGAVIWIIFELLRLCIHYPYIGVPLLLIVVAFFIYSARQSKEAYRSHVIRRAHHARDDAALAASANALRQADPSFDQQALLARVHTAFLKVQDAWARQDLAPVRPFLSDAVFERFSLQFDEQKALGYRNHMDRVAVHDLALAHAAADAQFDEVAIRVEASAIDQKVSLADGRVLVGSSEPQPFVEIWSFLRRRGAKSLDGKPGLIEGNCPNCGGALEMNQSAKCPYCGAQVRSGQYDWVLVEITQECEWAAPVREGLPGTATLLARDPSFNVQQLEDKASVVFWRRAAAERLNSDRPLRKAATEAFCDGVARAAAARARQARWYVGECAVGSADALGVLPAGPSGNGNPSPADPAAFDRALVEVRWSGTRFVAHPDGRIERGQQTAVARTLFVLARKPGATSNPDQAVSSAHCPTCGAPEAGGTSGVCDYCGAALNDGSQAWTLQEAVSLSAPRARELLDQLRMADVATEIAPATPPDVGLALASGPTAAVHRPNQPRRAPRVALAPLDMLAWMTHMTCADGQVDGKERDLLAATARRHGVPAGHLDRILAAAQSGTLEWPEPNNTDEAREQVRVLAEVALADGRLSSAEYDLLQRASVRLGLSEYDLKQLLKRTKADLYAAARQDLRAIKSGSGNGAPPPPLP